ncbi:MAG: carboxylating nicotinate-nucleotide diphosphorylase [Chitinophagaceae bacterium]|nr:carboxylating nicotinate-nucleotide diphosphorylase [Chitinophagaceae bacterium]
MNQTYTSHLEHLIQQALAEDVGSGDHSSLCCINPNQKGKAMLKVKENCIIAGVEVAKKIFENVENSSIFKASLKDGDSAVEGQEAFEVEASILTILKCERLVLNIMQRMSGIATLTKEYSKIISKYNCKILDTRKTTPNFRLLEKEAVRIGGGNNHRFGLYDMIMLKDNHLDYCGGISKAIELAFDYKKKNNLSIHIEIETRSIEEVKEVCLNGKGKVDRIMLDNFSPDQISEALSIINKEFETEASGGINKQNIETYAATGIDFISVGALIHQAKSVDLSLKAKLV